MFRRMSRRTLTSRMLRIVSSSFLVWVGTGADRCPLGCLLVPVSRRTRTKRPRLDVIADEEEEGNDEKVTVSEWSFPLLALLVGWRAKVFPRNRSRGSRGHDPVGVRGRLQPTQGGVVAGWESGVEGEGEGERPQASAGGVRIVGCFRQGRRQGSADREAAHHAFSQVRLPFLLVVLPGLT